MRPGWPTIPGFAIPSAILVALIAAFALFQGDNNARAQDAVTPIDPGPGTEHLGPTLWGLLQRHANGDATAPAFLEVELGCFAPDCDKVYRAVETAGGTETSAGTWRIATSRALAIIQLPEVVSAELAAGVTGAAAPAAVNRATMNDTLTRIVQAYERGVPAASAAQYALFIDSDHRMFVIITASSAADDRKVRKWLSDRNIYTPDSDYELERTYWTYVMLSAPNVVALADAFPTITLEVEDFQDQGLSLDRRHWPQEARDWEKRYMDAVRDRERAARTATTANQDAPRPEAAGGVSGASSSQGAWELIDLAKKRKHHGVDRWHSMNLSGSGVKVGIIDWGYADITNDPELRRGITKTTNWNNLDANMYCQPVRMGTWPHGALARLLSWHDCEPRVGLDEMRHGMIIAELVKDMAPDAQMYYAQANSPRQLYRAADWLNRQDVDVIVHAGGWTYDGPGNGWSPYQQASYAANPNTFGTNEHSPYRYFPSPLYTVDKYVKAGGPVWVNAAGNQEQMTMWGSNLTLVGGTS